MQSILDYQQITSKFTSNVLSWLYFPPKGGGAMGALGSRGSLRGAHGSHRGWAGIGLPGPRCTYFGVPRGLAPEGPWPPCWGIHSREARRGGVNIPPCSLR